MIFRFTKKTQVILKAGKMNKLPELNDTLYEWYVNIFYANKKKYIITTNAKTLYSVISVGKGVINTNDYFSILFGDLITQLKHDRVHHFSKLLVDSELDNIVMSSTLNKSILASMNDLMKQAKYFLGEYSVLDCSSRLNITPMGFLNMDSPIISMKKILEK